MCKWLKRLIPSVIHLLARIDKISVLRYNVGRVNRTPPQGIGFLNEIDMIHHDRRNGHGFSYAPPGAESNYMLYFPGDAASLLDQARNEGGSLITAGPGTGKSHLVSDVVQLAVQEGQPALKLSAHISGGSKKGADNALYVLDEFARAHPDGLVTVDNVDFYGYSGTRFARRYAVAQAHTRVASYLTEMMLDDQAPALCGTAHTQAWRDSHWLYGQKYAVDTVTPAAQTLLDAFGTNVTFDGIISDEVAKTLLGNKLATDGDATEIPDILEDIRSHAGDLYFRYVNHLPAEAHLDDINKALRLIDEGTAVRLGSSACTELN